jgi:uncharacterized protein (DUF1684 family)
MSDLDDFRKEKDTVFASDPQSPLTPEQKQEFKGLKYFPENPDLMFQVRVEEFPERTPIEIQTSTGDVSTYFRYGRLRFTIENQPVELTLYSTRSGDFFLPFVDALAGKETYGAGRYVEPEPLGNGWFLVDFNTAYNPYCAYNDNWSCPITPAENRLKVAVRAGEKTYHD